MFIFLLKINNLLHGAYRQSMVATLQLLIQGLTKRRKEKERKEKKRKKKKEKLIYKTSRVNHYVK